MKYMKGILAASLIGFCVFGGDDSSLASLVRSETDSALACTDYDGKSVELRKRPQRVVVCYSSFVGLWHLAGGRAVGMVDTSNKRHIPEGAKDVPGVGSFTNLNMERILELEPDLVLLCGKIEKQRAARDILAGRGIECLLLDYKNYKDFTGLLDLFARMNGKRIDELPDAERIVNEVEGIVKKASRLGSPRFASLFASARDIAVEGSDGSTACIASMLGGRNIVGFKSGDSAAGGMKFSLERLLMENPDIILFTTMGDSRELQERMKRDIMSNPAWRSLKAVKEGKVFFLPNELFLYKPNEKFPKAFRHLAKLMHPEGVW